MRQNKLIYINSVAILANALKKDTSIFDEGMQNMYLLTSVGYIIFNIIFPSDFPYLNDISDEILKFDIKDTNKKKYVMIDYVKNGFEVSKAIVNKKNRTPFKKMI